MQSRQTVDPELHILRSAVRTLEGRDRQQLESARFNLFAAFEAQDAEKARSWVRAVRVSLLTLPDEQEEVRNFALAAVDIIEQAIDS